MKQKKIFRRVKCREKSENLTGQEFDKIYWYYRTTSSTQNTVFEAVKQILQIYSVMEEIYILTSLFGVKITSIDYIILFMKTK